MSERNPIPRCLSHLEQMLPKRDLSETVTIEKPTKETLDFLDWATGAAVNEYYLSADDHSDADRAGAWLKKVEKACEP